jgi:hypothetical protein
MLSIRSGHVKDLFQRWFSVSVRERTEHQRRSPFPALAVVCPLRKRVQRHDPAFDINGNPAPLVWDSGAAA